MIPQKIIIVGAGQGGLQAAISLRQNRFGGSITLVGAEPGLPYQRPPLSKSYLLDGKADALRLRPESFFETKDVTYLSETHVDRIDRGARQISFYGPGGPGSLDYDHLILATGTRNLRPQIDGLEHARDLRTLNDAETLRQVLSHPQRIVVIGGGFIGLEFAAIARQLGHDVGVVEAAPRLMPRAVSPSISAIFAAFHSGLGTALHIGRPATGISPDGVTLADGTEIPASFVLLAAGVRPNTELAEEAGLECDNGIRVDARLFTSDSAISALGDCANFPDPRSRRHIRLESVQAATDHARLIAARLAKGDAAEYSALPWFWSDQSGRKLQIAGFADPQDREEIVADGIVARFNAHGLTAVETINNARVHMKARRLLAGDTSVDIADLRDLAKT